MRKYSSEKIIKALKKRRGLIFLAAKDVGCTPQTIRNRVKEEPLIAEALDTARGEMVDITEDKLFNRIEAEEHWAIALMLTTRGKDRGYGDTAADQLLERLEAATKKLDELQRAQVAKEQAK